MKNERKNEMERMTKGEQKIVILSDYFICYYFDNFYLTAFQLIILSFTLSGFNNIYCSP